MDERLKAEILATCDSIGHTDMDEYKKDPSCFECLKDLVMYLRKDDEDHSVRRLLGQAQVVQRDLLPLLKHYSEDLQLYDVILRLLVNLTQPALLVFDEEVPKNKNYLSQYLQIEQHLREYKAAFVDKLLWKKLTDRLRHLLNLEWDKRVGTDKENLERILVLIRNILMVPADPGDEKRTDDENSLHDRVLIVLHLSGIEDLLLYVASSNSTQDYCLHVMEIISLMLREQTGEQIAKTQLTRNEEDRVKDERELILIREKEAALKTLQMQKFSTRHSRFGGTFTVRDLKAPSGRDLLCHKPITSTADLSLDSTKKTKRTAINRMTISEDDPTRRSTISVRIILKEFCSEFLDGAYNCIMHVVKDNINRGRMQEHDETYYLWAMKFFMEFNRYHKFRVSYVSETMSTTAFHYVQTLLDNYQGMMVTDKDKIPYWSKRAHMALKSYQELLFTLLWMDKYGNETVKDSARVIKSNVFYLPEYRELCFGLLNTYDPVKFSKLYLKDLVETNHLFLKMLEDFSSSSRKILVKTKGKKRKKTKHSKNTKKSRRRAAATKDEEELEELWTTVSGEISSALLSTELPDGEEAGDGNVNVIPFDAASDIPIDEQKTTAVERIAVFLHTKMYKEAVTLFRASREVWPESKEEFGELGMEASDEIFVLKSIFVNLASLPAVTTALRDGEDEDVPEDIDEEEEEFEDEEEEEVRVASKEQEFDFFGFVLKYATPKVVCNYAKLFKDWESLKPFTLHCVMKMFHRFVFQMEYPALICQASIFRTFQKILKVADHRSDLKDIVKFFYHFWPKFVKLCENKTMFVEILFWKTAREAQEIQDGYGSYSGGGGGTQTSKPNKSSWTTEEENELVLLAEEYSALPDEAKRSTKIVEWIKERWTWRPKSKKMMINKLSEKGLVDSVVNLKNRRAPKTWHEDEIEKLRALYEEFKESTDIMGNILNGMEIKRSKNKVIQKMLEISLIEDMSEVKKKRVRGQRAKPRKRNQNNTTESDAEGFERLNSTETGRRISASSGSESNDSNLSDLNSEPEEDLADSPVRSISRIDSVDEDQDQANDAHSKIVKRKAPRRIRQTSASSGSESNDLNSEPEEDLKNSPIKGKNRIDSDDEDQDKEEEGNNSKKAPEKGINRIDSDDEDQDPEKDAHFKKAPVKGINMIDSDDEDQDQEKDAHSKKVKRKAPRRIRQTSASSGSESNDLNSEPEEDLKNSPIKGKNRIDSDEDEGKEEEAHTIKKVKPKASRQIIDSDED